MERYGLAQLRELMSRLRDPQTGCPWDLQQDHRSLLQHTLEEVYELADAVDRNDFSQMRDELGDYLFQAVFYAQIAAEQGHFDLDDVTHGIVSKLLRRHPHVFPDGTLQSRRACGQEPDSGKIRATWEQLKAQDRHQRSLAGLLDDVPAALPALQRAQKLQGRASSGGFDWSDWQGVLPKLDEEIAELREAALAQDREACEEELGDLLFSCVNLARHLGLNSEVALRRANEKFERRFRAIENILAEQGLRVADSTPESLEQLWNEVKRCEPQR